MFFGTLRLDIGFNRIQCGSAHTGYKVGSVPEHRLGIKPGDVISKTIARPARAGGFEVVDQHGHVERRVHIDEQMCVVGFASKLQEVTPPRGQDVLKRRSQVVQQLRREGFTPILLRLNFLW